MKKRSFFKKCGVSFLVFWGIVPLITGEIYYTATCFKIVPAFQEKAHASLHAIIKEDVRCSCSLLNENTNDKVYKLTFDHMNPLILRLNRRIPYAAKRTVERSQMAAAIGIAPPLLHVSPEKDVMITPFVEGDPIMDFNDSIVLQKFATAIKKFHKTYATTSSFPLVYKIGERAKIRLQEVERYLGIPSLNFKAYYEVLEKLDAFNAKHDKPQPIHGDLNQGNILLSGNNIVIVDWGDSVTSDIFDDLGGVAHYFAMTDAEEKSLLDFYFEGCPPQEALERLRIKRLETLLHHAAWAYLSLMRFTKEGTAASLASSLVVPQKARDNQDNLPLTTWMRAHPKESFSIKTIERALEVGKMGLEEFWTRYHRMGAAP